MQFSKRQRFRFFSGLRWARRRLPIAMSAWAVLFGLVGVVSDLLVSGTQAPAGLPYASVVAGAALWLRLRGQVSWSQALGVLVFLFECLVLLGRVPADLGAGGWDTALAGPVSLALVAIALAALDGAPFVAALLGSLASTASALAVVGGVTGAPAPYAWVGFGTLTLPNAIAIACLGVGVIASAFRLERPAADRALRWVQILVPVAVVAASLLLWLGLRSEAAVQRQRTIQATASGMAGEVAARVRFMTEALERLAKHGADIGGWASPDDWASDARIGLGSFSGFEAAWWVDSGLRTRQEAFPEGTATTTIRPGGSADDARLRSALLRARERGHPTVVAPIHPGDGSPAFGIVLPLTAVSQPDAFLVGVFSFDSSFASFFGNSAPGYDVALLVATRDVLRRGPAGLDRPAAEGSVDLGEGSSSWTLVAAPQPATLARLTTPLPELALGGGLLVAALLHLVIRLAGVQLKRSQRLEIAVGDRTAELESTLARLERENEARRRGEDTLRLTRQVERTLAAELEPRSVIQTVTEAVQELTGAQLAVFLFPESAILESPEEPYAISGRDDGELYRWVAEHHQELLSHLERDEPLTSAGAAVSREREGEGPGSVIGALVPSRFSTMSVGLLVLHEEQGFFGDAEEEIVSSLAGQAAVALDNAWLYTAERTARDEAQAASAAKDRFLRMLGHELRNPLGAVRNAVEVLRVRQKGAEPIDDGRMVDIVGRQVSHLGRMVDDLLDVSRIESGKLSLELHRIDLVSEVERIADAHAAQIDAAGLELVVELCSGGQWVDADPTRLAQIVGNLVSNAVKSTPRGGTVTIAVRDDEEGPTISVQDDGSGIAPDQLQSIFEPFAQGEGSIQQGRGGLGLGLSIVRGLVDAHGGSVEAHSRGLGEGAEFRVQLPRRSPPSREGPKRPEEARCEPLRVLVIDDHLDSAIGLVELLRADGHEVEMACDGVGGLEKARETRPELVICDLGMPGLDGYEVARRLRADPVLRSARIVALTGFGDEEASREASAAGFDERLIKPIDFATLRRVTSRLESSLRPMRRGDG